MFSIRISPRTHLASVHAALFHDHLPIDSEKSSTADINETKAVNRANGASELSRSRPRMERVMVADSQEGWVGWIGLILSLYGDRVFSSCSLEFICIPASIEVIGSYAFSAGSSDDSDDMNRSRRMVTFEPDSKLIEIRNHAFANCIALSCICIPASVQLLGCHCFEGEHGCASLQTVVFEFGSLLREIGRAAFSACSSLESICIPALVEIIPSMYFQACDSLYLVTFESDSRLARIEDSAFPLCDSLKHLFVPTRVTYIHRFAFRNTALSSITIEDGNAHCRSSGSFLLDLD
jgi:hypothetical protein